MQTATKTIANNSNVISFTKVDLPYGWLGNMYPSRLQFDGKQYLTAEALFQSLRFEGYPVIQEEIRKAKSPMRCKMIANSHKKQIADMVEFMGEKDVERMRLCLRLKVEQYPEIGLLLLRTGEKILVEDATKHPSESGAFWGAKLDDSTDAWTGVNQLGECWMELRQELREKNKLKAA
jgi:ribA/ribD-fused uncharacterized protein